MKSDHQILCEFSTSVNTNSGRFKHS